MAGFCGGGNPESAIENAELLIFRPELLIENPRDRYRKPELLMIRGLAGRALWSWVEGGTIGGVGFGMAILPHWTGYTWTLILCER